MQSSNKIMAPQDSINLQNQQFYRFMQTIKQQHTKNAKSFSKQDLSKSQFHHSLHQGSQILKDLQSLGSTSLHFQKSSHKDTPLRQQRGDQILKRKQKYGVAYRSILKQYQFPSQYFTTTKLKIQQYLKDSRLVPNVQVFAHISAHAAGKKQLFNENQISMLTQSKVLRGQTNTTKLSHMNLNIVLKYCLLHKLSEDSSIKEILIFFVKLLELLNYSIPQPKIQKYRDCIYFGVGLKKRQITEGFIYFFSGSVYIGQLLEHSMHGRGTQIFYNNSAIYKGDFRQGIMYGYFQVQKEDQKYEGIVQNGVYNGHGKLITPRCTVQGEFRQGKLISLSQCIPKQQLIQNRFRIRTNFGQMGQNQKQIKKRSNQKRKFSNIQFTTHQIQRQIWSFYQSAYEIYSVRNRSQ